MFKKVFLISSMAILSIPAAQAADNTIEFTGGFVSAPCKVTINDGNQTINLRMWNTSDYQTIGKNTEATKIKIAVSDCPLSEVSSVAFTFNGDTVSSDSDYFKIEDSSALAGLVGIGLYKDQSQTDVITPGVRGALEVPVSPTSGVGSQDIYASYRIFDKTVGGQANASISFDIAYN